MDNRANDMTRARRKRRGYMVLLCAVGLLINFLGVRLVRGFGLPLYLDNIGSALAAALGGYIPGIIVGFFVAYYLYTTYISCQTGESALNTYPYVPFWDH